MTPCTDRDGLIIRGAIMLFSALLSSPTELLGRGGRVLKISTYFVSTVRGPKVSSLRARLQSERKMISQYAQYLCSTIIKYALECIKEDRLEPSSRPDWVILLRK